MHHHIYYLFKYILEKYFSEKCNAELSLSPKNNEERKWKKKTIRERVTRKWKTELGGKKNNRFRLFYVSLRNEHVPNSSSRKKKKFKKKTEAPEQQREREKMRKENFFKFCCCCPSARYTHCRERHSFTNLKTIKLAQHFFSPKSSLFFLPTGVAFFKKRKSFGVSFPPNGHQVWRIEKGLSER